MHYLSQAQITIPKPIPLAEPSAEAPAPPVIFTSSVLSPKKIVISMIKVGLAKSKEPLWVVALLGWMSGMFVGFGSILMIICAGGITGSGSIGAANPALPKMLGGAVFPIALFLIAVTGAELFTGNTMYMTMALLQRKVTLYDLLRNWIMCYSWNFIGCLCSAYIMVYKGGLCEKDPYLTYAKNIAVAKTSLTMTEVFIRSILANWCVCLAVWFALSGDNMLDKIVGMWWPIFLFASTGMEHCVANMFLIPLGIMLGADVSVDTFIIRSQIPATLGNMMGGAIMVGFFEWLIYHEHMQNTDIATRPGRERAKEGTHKVATAGTRLSSAAAAVFHATASLAHHRKAPHHEDATNHETATKDVEMKDMEQHSAEENIDVGI